jgi:hypothetical protein
MSLDDFKKLETGHYVLYAIDVHFRYNSTGTSHKGVVIVDNEDFANKCVNTMKNYYKQFDTCNGITYYISYSKVIAVFDGTIFHGLDGRKYRMSHFEESKNYFTKDASDEAIIKYFCSNKKIQLRHWFIRYFVVCLLCGCCWGCMKDVIISD